MAEAGTFELVGRTALVSGCSRGIGAAIARALASAGADIVGVSRSVPTGGDSIAARVREAGRDFAHYPCALGQRGAVHALIAQLETDRRQIDILVDNAGITRRSRAAQHSDADWDDVLAVNLTAPFILSRELGRRMRARGQGRIIFTASVLNFQSGISVPGYAASKAATANLVRSLANEWAGQGVNVNAVAPGYVATDNTAALQRDSERPHYLPARPPTDDARPDVLAELQLEQCRMATVGAA